MTDRERELYETKYKPAYAAFMKAYPLSLDNLVGERWAWIRNYEGLYQESTLGRTKRFYKTKPAKIIAPHINVQGYLRMTLWKNGKCKKFTVSRLVAETFIPNANGFLQVDHIDGVKFNNSIENLRWATPSENMQFAVSSGLIKSGEDNYLA
ncbi:MAG: NUMOD4 motif-containing HNH endonuclease, partial [Selenomonadaceae bacterium]|nr:NUMOD4 motif-containing HNH endonuclease [Selenomonadaceae bacterium]